MGNLPMDPQERVRPYFKRYDATRTTTPHLQRHAPAAHDMPSPSSFAGQASHAYGGGKKDSDSGAAMKRSILAILLAGLLGSAMAYAENDPITSSLEDNLKRLVGERADTAVGRLGEPNERTTRNGFVVYRWRFSLPPDPPPPCVITLQIDPQTQVIRGYIWAGNSRGCAEAERKLAER